MTVFSIAADNKVAVFFSAQEVTPSSESFRSQEELATLAEHWPAARLVEVWNQLPGVKPTRRFTDRTTAVRRLWEAIRLLPAAGQLGPAAGSKRQSRSVKPSKALRRTTGRPGTKTEKILALLQRPSGATLTALMRATHWQAHSVRGFLSGQVGKKMGLKVKSTHKDGERVYAIQG